MAPHDNENSPEIVNKKRLFSGSVTFIVELMSLFYVIAFVLSMIANSIVFNSWGLKFLQVADFQDVAFSGFLLFLPMLPYLAFPIVIFFLTRFYTAGLSAVRMVGVAIAGGLLFLGIWYWLGWVSGLFDMGVDDFFKQYPEDAARQGVLLHMDAYRKLEIQEYGNGRPVLYVSIMAFFLAIFFHFRGALASRFVPFIVFFAAIGSIAFYPVFERITYELEAAGYVYGGAWTATVTSGNITCPARPLWIGSRAVVFRCDQEPGDILISQQRIVVLLGPEQQWIHQWRPSDEKQNQ